MVSGGLGHETEMQPGQDLNPLMKFRVVNLSISTFLFLLFCIFFLVKLEIPPTEGM